jgi:antitoxin ParD1/3/4
MQISLPDDLQQFAADQVEQGSFSSPAEVICEGVKLLKERERQLTDLRTKLQEGADQLKRGEGIPAAEVFAELHERNRLMESSMNRKRA